MKNLSLEQALYHHRHEKRRFRRKGEEAWCEVHDEKIVRVAGGAGVRGISLADAVAKDWELQSIYRMVSADEIREAALEIIRGDQHRRLGPMEIINSVCKELGLSD